jgi:hypothetical protein
LQGNPVIFTRSDPLQDCTVTKKQYTKALSPV